MTVKSFDTKSVKRSPRSQHRKAKKADKLQLPFGVAITLDVTNVPAQDNKENTPTASSDTNWRRRSLSAPSPLKVANGNGNGNKNAASPQLQGKAWLSLKKSQERKQNGGSKSQTSSARSSPRSRSSRSPSNRGRTGSLTSSTSTSSSTSPNSTLRSLADNASTLFMEGQLKPVKFYTPAKYRNAALISTEETHTELTQAITAANQKLSATTSPSTSSTPSPAKKQTKSTRRKTPTTTTSTESTTPLNPSAVEFAPQGVESPFNIRNPLGGKLSHFAAQFFKEAYGLEGCARKEHAEIIKEAMALTECSERAILEVLYGHSYSSQLQKLRDQVVGYPEKVRNKDRATCLKALLESLDAQPFYHFDGNKVTEARLQREMLMASTSTSTTNLLKTPTETTTAPTTTTTKAADADTPSTASASVPSSPVAARRFMLVEAPAGFAKRSEEALKRMAKSMPNSPLLHTRRLATSPSQSEKDVDASTDANLLSVPPSTATTTTRKQKQKKPRALASRSSSARLNTNCPSGIVLSGFALVALAPTVLATAACLL